MSVQNDTKEELMQEQILEAARQLFQQYGLRKVTMDDVARAIGKGRSSIYYYYKSKEEIFDAVVDVEISGMFAELALAVNKSNTAEAKLQAFVSTRLNFLRKKRAVFSKMDIGMDAEEVSAFNKTRQTVHQRIIQQQSALLKEILTFGLRSGELNGLDPKQMDGTVFVLLSCIQGLKQELVMKDDFSQIEPLVKRMIEIVMHGLKG